MTRERLLDFYFDHGAEVPLWWEGSGAVLVDQLPTRPELTRRLLDMQHSWLQFPDDLPDDDPSWQRFVAEARLLLAEIRQTLPEWEIVSTWLDEDAAATRARRDEALRDRLHAWRPPTTTWWIDG